MELLRENYVHNGGEDWNEVELENKFISPLIVLSKVDNRNFSYFLKRDSATVGEYDLSGKVHGMIASGFRSPKKPFFCLHKYKRKSDPNGDPKGQALVAMLAAQSLNNNQNPVLGCYVVGKIWRFIVLDGLNYFQPNLGCRQRRHFGHLLPPQSPALRNRVWSLFQTLKFQV